MTEIQKKWLIGGGVGLIMILILSSTFYNQGTNVPPNQSKFTNNSQIIPQNQDPNEQAKINESLNNISKIEGQKIKSVNDKTIELENNEKIEFTNAKDINCRAGDIISDYDMSRQALVCTRKDPQTGQTNTFWSSFIGSTGGSLLGSYIASKVFTSNNGYEFDRDRRTFRTPNGTTYNPDNNGRYSPTYPNNYPNTSRDTYKNNSGSNFGFGLFGGSNRNGNTNDSNQNIDSKSGDSEKSNKSNSGSKSTGGSTRSGSGGVSSGGGSGGG